MAASKDIPAGYGKLLDAWTAPDDAGDPIGCLATTFTFSPAFFEEECLSRFLSLETDAAEDGPAYIIEREEKLAQVTCAAVIVDQHHCKGSRSLRWDLFPARSPKGIFHAKISLLHWTNRIRVIIGSANLTEPGFRLNREVFGYLDYFEKSTAPSQVLVQTVDFLRRSMAEIISEPDSAPVQRMSGFLDRVSAMKTGWAMPEESLQKRPVRVFPVFTGPGHDDLFSQVKSILNYRETPHTVKVLSPFFDPPESRINQPEKSLAETIVRRGQSDIRFCVVVEPGIGDVKPYARAPKNLLHPESCGKSCAPALSRLTTDLERPLHAKEYWFEGMNWVLLVQGSSNFTSAGTGVGNTVNYEANLAYLLNTERASSRRKADFERRFPPSEIIENAETECLFEPEDAAGIDMPLETQILPAGFLSAVYHWLEGEEGVVRLTFGSELPAGWKIWSEDENVVFDESLWMNQGKPSSIEIKWLKRPPSGFHVLWKEAAGRAWWPVNVQSSRDLPPPEELKELTLDMLMEILTSARPLHEILRRIRKRPDGTIINRDNGTILNPHDRIDVSGFYLQRTRRFSQALAGLHQRLERPVPTIECLDWRLRGPIGVKGLAGALSKEARTEDENAFLLAELSLEIARVRPTSKPGCIPIEQVQSELSKTAREVLEPLPIIDSQKPLGRYIEQVKKMIAEAT